MDRRDWWAIVHGVAKSWTRLSDYKICAYIFKVIMLELDSVILTVV